MTAAYTLSADEEAAVIAQAAAASTDDVEVTPQAYADTRVRELFAGYAEHARKQDAAVVLDAYQALDAAEKAKVKAAFPDGKKPAAKEDAVLGTPI